MTYFLEIELMVEKLARYEKALREIANYDCCPDTTGSCGCCYTHPETARAALDGP